MNDRIGNRKMIILRTHDEGRWEWTEALQVIDFISKGKRRPEVTASYPRSGLSLAGAVKLACQTEIKRTEGLR